QALDDAIEIALVADGLSDVAKRCGTTVSITRAGTNQDAFGFACCTESVCVRALREFNPAMKPVAMRADLKAGEVAGDWRLPFMPERLFFSDEPRHRAIENQRREGFAEQQRRAAVQLGNQIFGICGQALWNQQIGNPQLRRYWLRETEDIKAEFRDEERDRSWSVRFQKTIGIIFDEK